MSASVSKDEIHRVFAAQQGNPWGACKSNAATRKARLLRLRHSIVRHCDAIQAGRPVNELGSYGFCRLSHARISAYASPLPG